jgi:hypothetical protein
MEAKCGQQKLPKYYIKELKNHAYTGLTLMALIEEWYEVIHHGETLPNSDFKNFKYTLHIEECIM